MVDQVLVDAVVGIEGVEQRKWNLTKIWIRHSDRINRVGAFRH
jgi:hypothetical protein